MKSKVTNLEKIAFGFGMLANQMFPAALGIFIIVLIQDLGFAAIMWGILQFAPRLFDAITDPLMGFISDNTKSKWGRRRQYVLIGGILMGISYIAMWQIYAENGEPKIRYTRGKSFARLMFGIGDAEETGSCRVYKKQF